MLKCPEDPFAFLRGQMLSAALLMMHISSNSSGLACRSIGNPRSNKGVKEHDGPKEFSVVRTNCELRASCNEYAIHNDQLAIDAHPNLLTATAHVLQRVRITIWNLRSTRDQELVVAKLRLQVADLQIAEARDQRAKVHNVPDKKLVLLSCDHSLQICGLLRQSYRGVLETLKGRRVKRGKVRGAPNKKLVAANLRPQVADSQIAWAILETANGCRE